MTDTSNSYSLRSTSASSYTSEQESFFINNKQIRFIRKISESKFPVYLVQDTKTNTMQACKLFPWNEEDDEPSSFYKKEVRFSQISHPNVTSITSYKSEQGIDGDDDVARVSYILMDYAKNGDLFDAVLTTRIPLNETLIRTYFQQIMSGLEAIHTYGAAHLDLKLENFLLDENFNIKITDFDLSFMAAEEKEVSTKGTINYRAPEIINECCENPQAADIYSAGIMLFLMKAGGRLPFKENDLYNGVNMTPVTRAGSVNKSSMNGKGDLNTLIKDICEVYDEEYKASNEAKEESILGTPKKEMGSRRALDYGLKKEVVAPVTPVKTEKKNAKKKEMGTGKNMTLESFGFFVKKESPVKEVVKEELKVMFDGVKRNELGEMKGLCEKYGVKYVEDSWRNIENHGLLVYEGEEVGKNFKVAISMARGKPIVKKAWLVESEKAGKLLDYKGYMWNYDTTSRKGLMQKIKFNVDKEIEDMPINNVETKDITQLIELTGGSVNQNIKLCDICIRRKNTKKKLTGVPSYVKLVTLQWLIDSVIEGKQLSTELTTYKIM